MIGRQDEVTPIGIARYKQLFAARAKCCHQELALQNEWERTYTIIVKRIMVWSCPGCYVHIRSRSLNLDWIDPEKVLFSDVASNTT